MGVRLFWAAVLGSLSGVFLRSLWPIDAAFVAALAVLAGASLIGSYLKKMRQKEALAVAIALIFCGVGVMRTDAALPHIDPGLRQLLGSKVELRGEVVEEPDVRESNMLIHIRSEHADILASVLPHTPVRYGDRVTVKGTLRLPEDFDAGEGREFHYARYLSVSGITFTLKNAQLTVIEGGRGNFLKTAAIELKQFYIKGLTRALPEPEAGLAAGITVGDKRSIGPELSEIFRSVSLIHIIVLSGYNITIVLSAIGRFTKYLPKVAHFSIAGLIVLFFVLMTGGASSAIRAGAMALIAMYARTSGRVFIASRALALFCFALVMWNPLVLMGDPSFQLSVLATLGLIYLTPVAESRLQWIPERFGLREIGAATIGTQLAVLPLLLYTTGRVSLVSVPANLLALVPTPLAMLFSFIAAIGGLLFGPLAPIAGFPALILLSYVIAVAKIFSALPFAALTVPVFSPLWLVAAYAALVALALKGVQKQNPAKGGVLRSSGVLEARS